MFIKPGEKVGQRDTNDGDFATRIEKAACSAACKTC